MLKYHRRDSSFPTHTDSLTDRVERRIWWQRWFTESSKKSTLCHRSQIFYWKWTSQYMGVSKNRGTPKWMVKIMENPIKMDDLGVPLFLETPIFLAFLAGNSRLSRVGNFVWVFEHSMNLKLQSNFWCDVWRQAWLRTLPESDIFPGKNYSH